MFLLLLLFLQLHQEEVVAVEDHVHQEAYQAVVVDHAPSHVAVVAVAHVHH
jgi:hypothetical protein